MMDQTYNHDRSLDPLLSAPTLNDIEAAARALTGIAFKTPLMENPAVNAKLQARLLVKAEMMQRTGSFKFRGAFNHIRQLSAAARRRGVIAYSSGNHAQAVASAASMANTDALIVMPDDAPAIKMARTKELGAKIITYDRAIASREQVAQQIQAERHLVMVPPSEDGRVLAGSGTVALELIRQMKDMGTMPDAILVPCGGGGLTAATTLVTEVLSPATKVYGVEPELFDDTRRSLEAGKRLANPQGRTTICDAIMTDMPGELTFSINRNRLAAVLVVSDDDVRAAMRCAFEHFKSVIEPGAAVALAAVLSSKIEIKGKTIAVIATGGNVDIARFSTALGAVS